LASANLERFGAYLVLGGLFGLAAPRRLLATLGATTVLAFALEAAQGLAPGRDPALADALVKALGGAAGVGATCLFFKARRFLAHLAREDQPVFALAPLIDP
jgi:VanZ family protein